MSHSKLAVEAVMFDLDGTLIDSTDVYYRIIEIVFAKIGVPPVSRKKILDAMQNGDFDWNMVLPEAMRDRKDEIIAGARLIIDEITPPMFRQDVPIIPGAEEMLKSLAAEGLKLGLVTSTARANMPLKMQPLRRAGVETLFEAIITTDDVKNKKPAADPLIACGEKLGVAVDNSVYVGDTRIDIRAGKAAGMKTLAVLTGFDDYDALQAEEPDAIINSVRDLRDRISFRIFQ